MADQAQSTGEIAGGASAATLSRITTLENNVYKVAYFASISADTGTITIPTGATILTDQFPGGVDALVSTISTLQPTGTNPVTAGAVTVDVTSFDTLGAYVLNGVPSAYPVALIYILSIPAVDWSNLTIANILEYAPLNQVSGTGTANTVSKFSAINTLTDSSITDTGTQVTTTQIWNNVATVFTALKADVTDTTSHVNSLLLDLHVGGLPKFSILKSGAVTVGSWTASTIGADVGGTGVANNAASTLTISGAFASTFTVTGAFTYTFPTATSTLLANSLGIAGGTTLIGGTGTTDDLTFRTTSGAGTTGADFIWQGGNNGATELMRLVNAGNFGIGMTPVEVLDITKTQNASSYIQLTNSNASTLSATGLVLSNGTNIGLFRLTGTGYTPSGVYVASGAHFLTDGSGGFLIAATNAAGVLKFTSGGTVERMRIDANGYVGIGTSAPGTLAGVASHLAMSGTGHVYSLMNVGNGSFEGTYLFSRNATLKYSFGMGAAATANFYIYDYANSSYLMYAVGGNVGLGGISTAPTAKVHIAAGTATASTAPLKFTAGTVLATPEAGTIEYITGNLVIQNDGLIIGAAALLGSESLLVSKNQNAATIFRVNNTNAGTAAASGFYLGNGTSFVTFRYFGSGFTTAGALVQNGGAFISDATGGLSIGTSDGTATYRIYTGGTAAGNLRHTISAAGLSTWSACYHVLAAGTATAGTCPVQFTSGTNLTVAISGGMEYNNTFHLTNSDATRRHIVLAPNTTKVTAGAPYANDGYVVMNIGGTDFKVMTTA